MSNFENKSPLPILRSPSHESINTNLSLFSVSSIELKNARLIRGPSPIPNISGDTRSGSGNVRILEPTGAGGAAGDGSASHCCVPFFEEDTDLLRTCAQLSAVLGLRKSFSASELSSVRNSTTDLCNPQLCWGKPRNAVSEMLLCCQKHLEFMNHANSKLQNISRSCSTWVAIGDVQSNLPSPNQQCVAGGGSGIGGGGNNGNFTPADLIRSVNKKVRQNYIQKRLLSTCKALERMSKSIDFSSVDQQLQIASISTSNLLGVSPNNSSTLSPATGNNHLRVPSAGSVGGGGSGNNEVRRKSKNLPLTIRDIEKEKGKPLSKYERNIMIFNWLHTLEDNGGLETLQ